MHISGEQLKQMAGVAAVLRFPMPIPDEDEEAEAAKAAEEDAWMLSSDEEGEPAPDENGYT